MADTDQNSQNTVKVIYLLYLANILIQFLGIIGVIVAYVNKDDAPEWLQSHYQFQIRTFWIGLLFIIAGGILLTAGVGALILLFWVIWVIIRCAKGIKYLDQKQPHPNPTTWLFS
ncbi:DUF4870 family protein [Methylophaga sp. OBS4]|uniref:DUF4870 family protein n=1 Tax=Methylophaga sp. OBS4 TaxID=2991935 RepID=UPI0022596AC3|nr:hypothetical protein [Methylophaga sp. OBS4]MCX4188536.1 hypothetical protein [Methylophaga sp. OBS4]